MGEYAGGSIRKWWDWGWSWVLSRKPIFASENDRHCSVFLILCFPTVQGTNNYSTELKVEQRVEVDLRGS